jgi:hypothetical protein
LVGVLYLEGEGRIISGPMTAGVRTSPAFIGIVVITITVVVPTILVIAAAVATFSNGLE